MRNNEYAKQLKNLLMLEAETEKEIRTDITDRITKNSMKTHGNSNLMISDSDGGKYE